MTDPNGPDADELADLLGRFAHEDEVEAISESDPLVRAFLKGRAAGNVLAANVVRELYCNRSIQWLAHTNDKSSHPRISILVQ
jgi:hypothetical protein